jgi:hypothetical protein
MEQHPIPQQISSYQFKLVGDMTLKQFFQVAGGVVISLIFYSLPLHPIIKWPFILFFVLLGVALAFLPLRERPLEKWIIAFFRSIYSPTLYTWEKTEKEPVFYTEEAVAPEIKPIVAINTTQEPNTTKLEEAEKSFLNKMGGLFSVNNQATTTNNQTVTTKHPIQPQISPAISFVNASATTSVTPPSAHQPQPNIPIAVPQQVPTVITRSAPKIIVQETPGKTDSKVTTTNIEAQKLEENVITSNAVEFSVDAAPPSPPIAVNTVVGQIMDSERKIIEGAILEIRDSSGRPVRALKSNKAGHFIIVTPLANGKYEIITEKDGFNFDKVSFEAKGEMIQPIAIKGDKI